MSYSDIIQENCRSHSAVPWWPKFAYHCTDVSNAVSILNSGTLYSRANAEHLGLMQNDNASRQVIDMTQTEAISCARFYFRPLTPTQYHNEGFKHAQLRYDGDENANMPVPVFFLFDLATLLSLPGIQFSEQKQSGWGSNLLSGEEAFANLNFKYIYSTGPENFREKLPYRHAEILHKNSFAIDTCLRYIVCRNNIEKTTLLNMLKITNLKAFMKYQDRVVVLKSDIFENNGLFITDCRYHDNSISINFSDTLKKRDYTRRQKEHNRVTDLKPVTVRLELDWYNNRSVLSHSAAQSIINYEDTSSLTYHGIPFVQGARKIRMQFFIENKLMCFIEQSLESGELIK